LFISLFIGCPQLTLFFFKFIVILLTVLLCWIYRKNS